MFYSETLLSKKGPLARVWLAANLERNLSKAQFLQTSIEKSVLAIVGDDVAPMALRLSGQLLLGVVRIYSRKAKYLLDDCNEALLKLRMTFSRGNVDLATSAAAANPQQLTLPNTITELDLLLPDPSAALGLSLPSTSVPPRNTNAHTSSVKDITIPELQDSIELGRGDMEDDLANIGEDDLVLDTGEYLETSEGHQGEEAEERYQAPVDDYAPDMSIEVGRDAQDVPVDYAERDDLYALPEFLADRDTEKPLELGDMEMEEMPIIDQVNDEPLSPLRDLDLNRSDRATVELEATPGKKARIPMKKKLKIDDVTELKTAYIRDMQENRTGIVKDYPSLPVSRDSVTLLNMYEKANFIDLIFTPLHMNESLRSLLAPDLLPEINYSKRKASAGADENEEGAKRLHIEEDQEKEERYQAPVWDENEEDRYALPDNLNDERGLDIDFPDDVPYSSRDNDNSAVAAHSDENLVEDDLEDMPATQAVNDISRHTKETAIVLQNKLQEADSIDFQALTLNSNRQQAVKFFFETLVLATKDALEVEQKDPYGLISIKAKDTLFESDWINVASEIAPVEVGDS